MFGKNWVEMLSQAVNNSIMITVIPSVTFVKAYEEDAHSLDKDLCSMSFVMRSLFDRLGYQYSFYRHFLTIS